MNHNSRRFFTRIKTDDNYTAPKIIIMNKKKPTLGGNVGTTLDITLVVVAIGMAFLLFVGRVTTTGIIGQP